MKLSVILNFRLYWSQINVRLVSCSNIEKMYLCCKIDGNKFSIFLNFFYVFSIFFFSVLSCFIMSFLYFCFSMFCLSMFCHRPNSYGHVEVVSSQNPTFSWAVGKHDLAVNQYFVHINRRVRMTIENIL